MTRTALPALLAAALLAAGSTQQASAFTASWSIHDHPDGALKDTPGPGGEPPGGPGTPYGLRLDNAIKTATMTEHFLWSFDHPLSNLTLTYDSNDTGAAGNGTTINGESIRIQGSAWGGVRDLGACTPNCDTTNTWSQAGLWDFDLVWTHLGTPSIDLFIDGVKKGSPGSDPGHGFDPSGHLLEVFNNLNGAGGQLLGKVEVKDAANKGDFSVGDFFELKSKGKSSDPNNALFYDKSGHRLNCAGHGGADKGSHHGADTAEMCDRWTGAGWVQIKHSKIGAWVDEHGSSGVRDFLFTGSGGGTPGVPEPGPLALLGIGLAGLMARRRR